MYYHHFYIAGSTHDVSITEDFDDGFGELVSYRHGGGPPPSIGQDNPESFKFEDVKRHTITEDSEGDQPLIQF